MCFLCCLRAGSSTCSFGLFLYCWSEKNKCAGENWSFPAFFVDRDSWIPQRDGLKSCCSVVSDGSGMDLRSNQQVVPSVAGLGGAWHSGRARPSIPWPILRHPQLPFRLTFYFFIGILVCNDSARRCFTCSALVPNAQVKTWIQTPVL